MRRVRFAVLLAAATAVSLGAAVSVRAAQDPRNAHAFTHRLVRHGIRGVDVRIDFDLHAALYNGPAGTSPFLDRGTLTIVAGPGRERSAFSLASIGALPPALPQTIEPDYHTGCGSAGPVAFEPLDRVVFPAVVVVTVIGARGCYPVAHVFVPDDDRVATYAAAPSFETRWAAPAHAPLMRTFTVSRMWSIDVRKPAGVPYVADRPIEIVRGPDPAGRRVTIALDRPDPDLLPRLGGSVALYRAVSREVSSLPVAVVVR